MKQIQFSIEIQSSKENVWNTLWNDTTFRIWANIIDEGTYMVGELIQGKTVQFLSGSSGYGVTSYIENVVQNEFIRFKHLQDTMDLGFNTREPESLCRLKLIRFIFLDLVLEKKRMKIAMSIYWFIFPNILIF